MSFIVYWLGSLTDALYPPFNSKRNNTRKWIFSIFCRFPAVGNVSAWFVPSRIHISKVNKFLVFIGFRQLVMYWQESFRTEAIFWRELTIPKLDQHFSRGKSKYQCRCSENLSSKFGVSWFRQFFLFFRQWLFDITQRFYFVCYCSIIYIYKNSSLRADRLVIRINVQEKTDITGVIVYG